MSLKPKEHSVDWSDKEAIKARFVTAKSAVTRACTAIDKLVLRPFIYSTQAAIRYSCASTRHCNSGGQDQYAHRTMQRAQLHVVKKEVGDWGVG